LKEDEHMTASRTEVPEEQQLYARWLAFGVRLGFGALVTSFVIYLTQLVPPSIPPSELPRYWSLPVAEYIAATGAPTGWSWVMRLGESDLLNFVGVAILGSTTVLCYLHVLPLFLRRRERALVAICILEIIVLAGAASGFMFTHHWG
jgi:hypothetical protein